MKQILVICAAMVALVGCETKSNKGQLDPNSIISIRPAEGVKAAAENPEYLTARQIIEQGNAFWRFNPAINPNEPNALAIDAWNRDLENLRFKVGSTSVIGSDGTLTTNFMDSKNIIVAIHNEQNRPKDTIAYIPNKVMSDAAIEIKAAYAAENYAECYRLFDQAFRFLPTTGKEYREMQAQGKN